MAKLKPSKFSVITRMGETPCGQVYTELQLIAGNEFMVITPITADTTMLRMKLPPTELWKLGATLQQMARDAMDVEAEVNGAD
jgi:hypothetical protein